MSGIGLPPTGFPEQVFVGSLLQEVQCYIDFKNPYDIVIQVAVSLEHDEHGVFRLFGKNSSMQFQPHANQQIPFTFRPQDIAQYQSMVVFKLNEQISWQYPIKGVAEQFVQQP